MMLWSAPAGSRGQADGSDTDVTLSPSLDIVCLKAVKAVSPQRSGIMQNASKDNALVYYGTVCL